MGSIFGCFKKDEDIEKGKSQNPDQIKNASKTIKLMIPYFWPEGNIGLKVRLIICLLSLFVGKIFNIMVPMQLKEAINLLPDVIPWVPVILYSVFKLLASSIGDFQDTIFINVSQHATREITVKTYAHLHDLSLAYHLRRNTGAVLRVIDRGIDSVKTLLRIILFNIVPTIIELFMVCVVLFKSYNGWYSLVAFLSIVVYVVFTFVVTEWRKKFRREMNEKENETNSKAVDSLINFETVKYFTAEKHIVERYKSTLNSYFTVELKSRFSLAFLNIGQYFTIGLGLFIIMTLAILDVKNKKMKVGDIVAINLYIIQLFQPLSWLGASYQMIINSFVNMEKMFELLEEELDVKDSPEAEDLFIGKGNIEFDNVKFSYGPDREILKGINFSVPGGTMTAIVGATGSGKSTIVRLLCRFYDVTDGAIYIDGENIRSVRQRSLRKNIGVVPQDTVLFNDNIKYNIQFGGFGRDSIPNDEEVIEAAKGAVIHDMIMKFPDGYNTMVGERGLRLSGGEKQRVAIARTILKDPPILILDEATSALDTKTEKGIQDSLIRVAKGRTTLVIAHRLSTVKDADEIIVLKEGIIVERGAHFDLLNLNGEYAQLWYQQLKTATGDDTQEAQQNLIDI